MSDDRSFTIARKAMIDSQLRTSGINQDFVLARMGIVPRENFVHDSARAIAYMDRAVPLGEGRFLAAPLFHGAMLAEAAPVPGDSVLVVESGSGYLAELVRPLAGTVQTVTIEDALAASRKRTQHTLMLIDGAVEEIPAPLAARLVEGGRVVTGLVSRGVTRLASGRKTGKDIALLELAEMGIPVLQQFARPKAWSF